MSKPKTYPIVEQIQSNDIRRIYKSINPESASGYRTLGAANSDISKQLFPASPFHSNVTLAELDKNDRGKLLVDRKIAEPNSPLTDDLVTQMFATVIDGSSAGSHVKAFGNNNNNYSWLYRDKPMDMNFAYLDKDGIAQAPTGSGIESEPGGNETITSLGDKPHWGYPNINVINNEGDTFSTNPQRSATPDLAHASNGFGTPVERPFSTRETIGTYFTSVHVTGKTQVLGSSIPDTPKTTQSLQAEVIASLPYNKTALDSIQTALSQGVVRQAITNRQLK